MSSVIFLMALTFSERNCASVGGDDRNAVAHIAPMYAESGGAMPEFVTDIMPINC
jgi:hypothetical protein